MISFQEPWEALKDGNEFNDELSRELSSEHILFGKTADVLARRQDCDDFLFEINKGECFAVVHLTWQKETEAQWPRTELFESLENFKIARMIPDAKEWE